MTWIAHKRDDGTEQLLVDHLSNVSRITGQFAAQFGMEQIGRIAGYYHDVGKYSKSSQKRMRGDGPRVDHSTAGAQLVRELYGKSDFINWMIALPIMSHHTGLCDWGSKADLAGESTFFGRIKKSISDFSDYSKELKKIDLSIKKFQNQLPEFKNKEEGCLYFSTLIRMLYSSLVDADFLDTEAFMSDNMVKRNGGESLEVILARSKEYLINKKWLELKPLSTINGRRSQILNASIEMGRMSEPGFFSMTVPTGGGKTVSSFMFALEHAIKNNMERIIYVVPYTTIIEQTAQVLRKLAGSGNVLEHHSNFDFKNDGEGMMLKYASENWDIPIVVTTSVQFFESFYANRSSSCRKVHNYAKSVIVFDEAQKIPKNYLSPCLKMMEDLVDYYKCSAVICTATQPALAPYLKEGRKMREICPDVVEEFDFFKRNTFENIGAISENDLILRLEKEDCAMCIVNTRRIAQKVYYHIKNSHKYDYVYHLSTTMHREDRISILKEIRRRLDHQEKCILIATSLVEAGVDLDFDVVYRQLAGVDSIIQAAGRCNREGKKDSSIVYIFDLEDEKKVQSQRKEIAITEIILKKGIDLNDPKAATEYFEEYYDINAKKVNEKSVLDKKKILSKAQEFSFKTIADEFHLIEEDTKTIVIPDDSVILVLERIDSNQGKKEDFKLIQKYSVSVPENQIIQLLDLGKICPVNHMVDLYVLVERESYEEQGVGLILYENSGSEAIFW